MKRIENEDEYKNLIPLEEYEYELFDVTLEAIPQCDFDIDRLTDDPYADIRVFTEDIEDYLSKVVTYVPTYVVENGKVELADVLYDPQTKTMHTFSSIDDEVFHIPAIAKWQELDQTTTSYEYGSATVEVQNTIDMSEKIYVGFDIEAVMEPYFPEIIKAAESVYEKKEPEM